MLLTVGMKYDHYTFMKHKDSKAAISKHEQSAHVIWDVQHNCEHDIKVLFTAAVFAHLNLHIALISTTICSGVLQWSRIESRV